MAYGTIKIDTITFTDGGIDKSVAISGLVQNPTFTGNVTVTGTISGNTVRGQTISGVTVTGTTANFTSGNFTNISGDTHTITSGVFASGTAANPSISFVSDPNTGIYSPGADQVAISTNGTGRLFVDASGNVGVGTSTPNTSGYGGGVLGIFGSGNNGGNIWLTSETTAAGNRTGRIGFGTEGNTVNKETARIWSTVDGTTAGNLGGNLLFNTKPDGGSLTERMRLDSSGRLGLGNSSPTSLLTVGASSTANPAADVTVNSSTVDQYRLKLTSSAYNADTKWLGLGFGYHDNYLKAGIIAEAKDNNARTNLHFCLDGNANNNNANLGDSKMVITYDGNVGIGTTTPSSLLTSYAGNVSTLGAKASSGLCIENNGSVGNISQIGLGYTFSSTHHPVAIAAVTESGAGSTRANLVFAVRSLTTDAAPEERARIDSSGRLLVGTSTALTNVLIKGDLGSSAATTPQQQFALAVNSYNAGLSVTNYSASGYGGVISLNSSKSNTLGTNALVDNTIAVGAISFNGNDGTNFVPCAEIKAAVDGTPGANDMPGRLVFSTTADGASSPTERMRISRGGSAGFFCDTSFDVMNLASSETAGSARWFIYATYGASAINTGTQSFGVYTNGNVVNTNNSYGSLSDIKLKENIVDANSQWNDLKALQVRNYNFKEGQTHTQIGLIAQEVELVSPGLVSESPDRDAEGNDLGTVTKSVNYSVLYMKAVKALQEAMERIEVLEAKVNALEGN